MMDLIKAKFIYNRAIAVQSSRNTAEAEAVSSEYLAFQKENPDLPRVEFIPFNYDGSIIQPSSPKWADPINRIIKALEPYVCKPNDDEFLVGKATIHSGALEGPVTIKIHKDQEPIRRLEKQALERKRTQELSLFLDSILKEAKFMETEWLEFKTIFLRDRYDYLGRIFSSLSNTARLYNLQYAYLIYGINEPKREISGTNFSTSSNTWQVIEQELHQRFTPSIKFEILEFNYNDDSQKHIVIFKIHAAGNQPIAYCGESFFRHGDKPIPLKDYPDFLKIISNTTSQQPVDNSIIVIIQIPQTILNINLGDINIDIKDSFNTNSNNEKSESPGTNIGSNNKDDHSININTKEKVSIWVIIVGIATILGVPFSGFALRFCDNNKPVETIVSSSSTDALKYSSEAIHANHPTDSVKVILSDTINHLKKDTLLLVRKDTVIVIQKDTTINNLKNISLINEACVLYHDAKSIYPDGVHIAGDVESLANSFNKFAKKIKNDKIELCSKFDDGLGTLTECGRKILKTVKRELEIYIRNNKINCNQ